MIHNLSTRCSSSPAWCSCSSSSARSPSSSSSGSARTTTTTSCRRRCTATPSSSSAGRSSRPSSSASSAWAPSATLFNINSRDDAAMTVAGRSASSGGGSIATTLDGDGDFDDIITANDLVIPAGVDVELQHQLQRRHPLLLGPGAQRQEGRRPRPHARPHARTPTSPAPTSASAPSSAACPTPTCASGSSPSPQDQFDEWLANQETDAADAHRRGGAPPGPSSSPAQCSRCHLAEGINDDEFEEEGGTDAGRRQRPRPHPLHHPRRLRRRHVRPLARHRRATASSSTTRSARTSTATGLEAWLRDPPAEKPMARPRRSRACPTSNSRRTRSTSWSRSSRRSIDEGFLRHGDRRTTDSTPLELTTGRTASTKPLGAFTRPQSTTGWRAGSPPSTTSASASCTAPRRCSSS